MNRLRFLLPMLALLLIAGTVRGQITHYSDSASFDDDFARLREIDFEDIYSVTLQRVTIRNPWGLNCYGFNSQEFPDSIDNSLLIGQGATLEFPTRTRTVELEGGSHQFQVIVTDFNDDIDTLAMQDFPVSIIDTAGIRKIQFLGADQFGDYDINWRASLLVMRALDSDGDTLAFSNFDELKADHYYLIGIAQDASQFFPDSTFQQPIEWHGITITEPTLGFAGLPLAAPEGRVDPDNPIMNLEIELAPGATIDCAEGTEGVLLTFEAIHHLDTFWVAVTDYAGRTDTVEAMGWGHPIDTNWVESQQYTFVHLGFGSPDGIRRVEFLGTTGPFSFGTVALATVAVAETPVIEMATIKASVDELDSAGFLDGSQAGQLRDDLVAAMASAENNDRGDAIARLNSFRSDVQQLAGERVLVSEEEVYFLNEAAYVIARLRGPAGVEAPVAGKSMRVELGVPVISHDGMYVRYSAPRGSNPTVGVYDLRGALLRTLPVAGTSGELLWDLHDGNGARVSAGVYLVTLTAGGERTTRLVRVVR